MEGFRARAGAKERHQALSEYEVARRVGFGWYSYAEYETSPERERVRVSLSRLQRRGMVRSTATSGRYETFVPVDSAIPHAASNETGPGETADAPGNAPSGAAAYPSAHTTIEGRMDEMIRLLRSIDNHLARITRS